MHKLYTCTDNINGEAESFAPPSCENIHTTSSPPTSVTTESKTQDSSFPVGAVLGSIIGCAVVAAALAFLIAAAVYKHHKKKDHSHNGLLNNNHTIDGKLVLT